MNKNYSIFQLPAHHRNKFMGIRWAKQHNFQFSEYVHQYNGVVEEGENDMETLERIFYILNMEHPSDYHTHSLSVSDIVKLHDKMYFCDSIGFVEVGLTRNAENYLVRTLP